MKRVFYAGSSFLTGNAIADALVSYTEFLVEDRSTDYVDIPVRHADGCEGRAWFLLGPDRDLFAQPEFSPWYEVEDYELVSRLRQRSSSLPIPTSGPQRSFAGEYFHLHRFDGVALIPPHARS